jgi:hypothetical protein
MTGFGSRIPGDELGTFEDGQRGGKWGHLLCLGNKCLHRIKTEPAGKWALPLQQNRLKHKQNSHISR